MQSGHNGFFFHMITLLLSYTYEMHLAGFTFSTKVRTQVQVKHRFMKAFIQIQKAETQCEKTGSGPAMSK